MTIDIRLPEPHELRAACDTMRAALMNGPVSDEDWAKGEPSWTSADSITAWDDHRCVGHAGAFRFDTTVPGGARLATAGVTRVGVLPTHTRRGLLSGMMTQLLTDARERGQVLASLRASEGVIYERFGFGVAGDIAKVTVDAHRARPLRRPETLGSMRILSAGDILEVIPAVYERSARQRVGTISRSEWMWRRYLDEALPGKSKASFVAVHDDSSGAPDGYVHYELAWTDNDSGALSPGVGTVNDLFGATPAVEIALWQYLLDIDLVGEWKADERPLDDVIRFAATDLRAHCVKRIDDEQWLRILDVDVALGSRTYSSTDGGVVIQVTDPLFATNGGTWRIDSYGAFRAHGEPELVAGIEALSAAYLGGTSWRELADAGRLVERSSGAVDTADRLFRQRPLPYCGSFF